MCMDEIKDFLPFFQYLVNGFVAAWIFFGLTSFVRASPFERVVHALILTAVVSFVAWCLERLLLWGGREWIALYPWDGGARSVTGFFSAIVVGLFLAYSANNDLIHGLLRKINITRETSFPSEWYGSFADQKNEAYVVLHLEDGRRLMGFPSEWPSTPMEGHFVLYEASWLQVDPDGEQTEIRLDQVEKILIDVRKVVFVEFLKYEENYEQKTA